MDGLSDKKRSNNDNEKTCSANNDCGIGCNCSHCAAVSEKKAGKSSFWANYGAEISKLIVSSIILSISVFFVESELAMLLLSVFALLIVGFDLLLECLRGIAKGEIFGESTLMIIASITALCIGEYTEGAAIIVLFAFGELLEGIATDNSRKRIAGLSELKTSVAHLLSKDGERDVDPAEVEIGSLIEIRRGDRVPIDGVLVAGRAELDMKSVTGESKTVSIVAGDNVYSGALNLGDPFVVKTTKLFKDSTVEQIIALVEGANAKKAKSQKFITSFSKIYTPCVVIIGFLIALLPPLFDGMNFVKWIYKGLSFLVISCPCALVISVPLGFFIGIGSLSRTGVLIKGSSYIERLSSAKIAVFDKTGTLTKGSFVVDAVRAYNGFSEDEVAKYASALERSSSHPVAKAIASFSSADDVTVKDIKEVSGRGMCGEADGRLICVGNLAYMKENGIDAAASSDYPGTTVYISINGVLAGELLIKDEIKENAKSAIEDLKKCGITKTYMISGDCEEVCKSVGEEIGISEVYSELLPAEKYDKLVKIKDKAGDNVIYVGDGINDAPSLALADVGIAMGGLGSEAAVDSSDVVILDDDLTKIAKSIRYSKRIQRKVKENIIGSLAIKFIVMILSVIPSLTLPVWCAMLADVGVMLLAVANSLTNYKKIK